MRDMREPTAERGADQRGARQGDHRLDAAGCVMDDLVEWLKRRLDDDEASEWPHRPSCQMVKQPGLSCNCDAADRWWRDIDAKRRRLERHRPEARTVACGEAGYAETWLCCVQCSAPYGLLDPPEATKWPCLDIRDDAAIYSDRPGYREEWRP